MKEAEYERQFPGKGKILAEVIEPFRNWKPGKLSSIQDLDRRLIEAIFWRNDLRGVRRIPPLGNEVPFNIIEGRLTITPTAIGNGVLLIDFVYLQMIRYFEEVIPESPETRQFVENIQNDFLPTEVLSSFDSVSVRGMEVGPFVVMVAACALIESKEAARRFLPLLKLMHEGCVPYGFDQDNNVLVLDV